MAERQRSNNRKGKFLIKSYQWIMGRLERTIFRGIRFLLPKRLLSIHGFLGMLTFITFIILGITGVLLMFYYRPSLTTAYESVRMINDEIDFGFILRNIHYHASNAMIFLALYHMFYQLFSGRYKIKNELIWVTGIILGTLTIIEAYTGYDLILNERAVLAINIGVSLTNSIPIIGRALANLLMGSGFTDIIFRFYTFHVIIIPLIMIILVLFHFPRNLILDIPMIAVLSGAILIVGGLSPVELGNKFDPTVPPGITVPEWYLTGLYAFLRTGIDKFIAGALLPALFIFTFMAVPFIDRGRKLSWKDRPFITGLGISGLCQIIVTTAWGFYINPNQNLDLSKRLAIDPLLFYSSLVIISIVSFGVSYAYSRWFRSQKRSSSQHFRNSDINLNNNTIFGIILVLLFFQFLTTIMALETYTSGLEHISMILIGSSLVIFGVIFHLLRAKTGEVR